MSRRVKGAKGCSSAPNSRSRRESSAFRRAQRVSLSMRFLEQFWRWLGEAGYGQPGSCRLVKKLTFQADVAQNKLANLEEGAVFEEVLRS